MLREIGMGIVDASAALLNEGVSTCSATAGFLLTAFGIVGTGGALVPLLALSSILLIPMKIFHIKRLESRSTRLQNTTTKKMYTALRNKEAGTALALGVTTLGAGVLSIHSAASAATTMGVLHPALSLMALGFAMNALVEFYDNVCQWRERVNAQYYAEDEKAPGKLKEKQTAAARNLAFSSFIKLLGWSCVVTGGFALAAPFAPWLVPVGLALVAGSHFYSNFFAAPRVIKQHDNNDNFQASGCWDVFASSLELNSCRGGKCLEDKPNNTWLQLF